MSTDAPGRLTLSEALELTRLKAERVHLGELPDDKRLRLEGLEAKVAGPDPDVAPPGST